MQNKLINQFAHRLTHITDILCNLCHQSCADYIMNKGQHCLCYIDPFHK